MRVTSIATGASLNTRPDVPHVGNVDYNAVAERTFTTQQSLCTHSQCIYGLSGSFVASPGVSWRRGEHRRRGRTRRFEVE